VLRPRQQEKLARGAKPEEHAMSPKANSAIAVMGIDIGKNSIHVVGQDKRGAIMLRQKWSRGQVEARLANLPQCLIGMEACVGAHHLSRKLQMLGHDARLMPAKYVRPYSKGQKNDFRDAEAITEAVQRPTMKFVATKTAEQLDLQALHRVREPGLPTVLTASTVMPSLPSVRTTKPLAACDPSTMKTPITNQTAWPNSATYRSS
jgi:transposase